MTEAEPKRWAVILPGIGGGYWSYQILEVRKTYVKGDMPAPNLRLLCGVPGQNRGVWLFIDEIMTFADFEKARRYLVALMVLG